MNISVDDVKQMALENWLLRREVERLQALVPKDEQQEPEPPASGEEPVS